MKTIFGSRLILLFFCAGIGYADSIVVNETPPYSFGETVTFGATYAAYARHQITKKQWDKSP
jgi:hypothetical protein